MGRIRRAVLALMLIGSLAAVSLALRREAPRQPEWRKELLAFRPFSDGERVIQPLSDGGLVELTLSPVLQPAADRLIALSGSTQGAAVLLSVKDGRVLALSGGALALSAWAPAASVFKLVTAAALVEKGVSPKAKVCYHSGLRSVEADNLEDHPDLDRTCHSFAWGLARSQNAIIGRLAHDHLDAGTLVATARAFDFGAPLAFALPVAASTAEVPPDGLAFARVAAGFWQTSLSPLHGAYLAATIARGGATPPLRLVERVDDARGNSVHPPPTPTHRAISETAARTLAAMMVGTTEFGSARLAFRHGHKRRLPVAVAGKTGSLNRKPTETDSFLAYSWFVGFAPANRPEVAVAVLLGNGADGGPRAAEVARDLLSVYFTAR
jgi:cell division protein FtsI/penicillin-binding protein 2